MTRNSHVFSSILTIAIMILPIMFVIGVLIPTVIHPLASAYISDEQLFYTICGIILLIAVLIPPPPNKKKRSIFTRTIKILWRKFIKPKLSDEIKFDNEIIHFAKVESPSENCPFPDEFICKKLGFRETPTHKYQSGTKNPTITNKSVRTKTSRTNPSYLHRLKFCFSNQFRNFLMKFATFCTIVFSSFSNAIFTKIYWRETRTEGELIRISTRNNLANPQSNQKQCYGWYYNG